VNIYKLSNGISVVSEHIPSTRSVSFGIWVKAGSRNESSATNGITHLIEHMLFKGTSNYSAIEIANIFDGFGGNINAFTSKENTCYYFVVLDQHLPKALAVLADMFFHSSFDADELEKEKNVVYEEIAMYDDTPDDHVHDLIASAAFQDHSIAFPILGDVERLQTFHSNDLRNYMNTHYSLSNIVISIAGNISDELPNLLEQHFSFYSNQGEIASFITPNFQGGVSFRQKQTEQHHLCLALPGIPLGDKRTYSMSVLNNIIGGGMSSRLFQEIREQRGLAYSVYSYHGAYSDSGLFVIYAGTLPKQSAMLLDVTMDVLSQIAINGVLEDELVRTKEQLKGNFILSSESSSSRMHRMGRNELMLGKHLTMDEVLQKLDSVTIEEIAELASHLFSQPFAIAMVGNDDKVLQSFRRDQLVLSS
jgi:predicted Zn-dependent peptidase